MKSEKQILLDHIGPDAFESPEVRDLKFKDARRTDLLDICDMYGIAVERNQPKLISNIENGSMSGLVVRMQAFNEDGLFDKTKMHDGVPMSVSQWRIERAQPKKAEPKSDTKAA